MPQAEKDGQLKEAWHANLYAFLYLIPANDVSLLLHQVRKWLVLEKKGEAGAEANNSDVQYVDKIKQLIAVMELYIDMADANFTGQEEKHGFEGVQDLYEPAAFEKMMQNQNSTQDQMQLEFVRRGLRKMHHFGHLPFVKDLMGHEQKITEQQVTDYIHKKENHIEGWLQKREAMKECAIEAQKLSYEECFEKFSEEDFNNYKQLIADITNYNFEAERIRLITHIKAYDKTLLLIGKLVDIAGIWERDHFFMLLAIMYIFKIEPITFFAVRDEAKNQADKFLKSHTYDDFSGEGSGDLQQVYSICKKLGLLGEQYNKSKKNRDDIAHFNILAEGAKDLNITDQINAARKMMAYDRKMKNAVSKSIKDLMEREGVLLTWKTEEKGHNLKISKVHAKEIYHLKAWLEKHKQWRKFQDKKDIEAKYNEREQNKEKRTRSIARNKEYERGGHYCIKEQLQSDDLIQAIKRIF